ncbi:MAG: hemerythrin family protein [Campylobacterota bacterium]|nr:hemerythrin family protein [Campylobacterota bacterium]
MLLDKKSLPIVAMEFMNDVHMEDVDIINELFDLVLLYEKEPSAINKAKIDQQYKEWFEHTVEHFKGEEEKMQEMAFPPYPMHKGEHDNALAVMDDVFRKWQESGEIMILKTYLIETLPAWLNKHIQTMDTVTAMFFKTGMSPCSIH